MQCGGNDADEEAIAISAATSRVSAARNRNDKISALREWLDQLLRSRFYLRDAGVRRSILMQLDRISAMFPELSDKLSLVYPHVIKHGETSPAAGRRIYSKRKTMKKRYTRKRGGFKADAEGLYANKDTEVKAVGKLVDELNQPDLSRDAKKDILQRFFDVILSSKYVLRNRSFRAVLEDKLVETDEEFPELSQLTDEVRYHLDAHPIDGGKRKTRRRRHSRK